MNANESKFDENVGLKKLCKIVPKQTGDADTKHD